MLGRLLNKTYELSIHRDYVAHWTLQDAVREIIQNALDAIKDEETPIDQDFGTIYPGHYSMFICTPGVILSPDTLLLGKTTKASDSDSIGQFGEGYKLAMLTLLRAGFEPAIYTGKRCWTPVLRKSSKFKAEVLCFDESKNTTQPTDSTTFVINNLSPGDVDSVKEVYLWSADPGRVAHTRNRGDILLDKPGKLYVGGLYICDTKLTCGYNVKPAYIKLERDRKTVSGFELKYCTSLMWAELVDNEHKITLSRLLHENVEDIQYLSYSSASSGMSEACYEQFKRAAGEGALIVRTQAELDELRKKTNRNIYYTSNSVFYDYVKAHPDYHDEEQEELPTPGDALSNWLSSAEERGWITPEGANSLQELIENVSVYWYDNRS